MRLKPWLFLLACFSLASGVLWFYATFAVKARPLPAAPAETADALVPTAEDGMPFVTFVDPYKGATDGAIVIVAYGDYACPYCRDLETDIDRLIAAHPGKIKFVWKDLPNPLHFGADLAAEASQCAKAQGKFWEFHARVMDDVTSFTQSRIILLADELELDTEAFNRCVTEREMKPLIDRSIGEAVALGVDATPYLFIGDERFSGQPSYELLEEAIAKR